MTESSSTSKENDDPHRRHWMVFVHQNRYGLYDTDRFSSSSHNLLTIQQYLVSDDSTVTPYQDWKDKKQRQSESYLEICPYHSDHETVFELYVNEEGMFICLFIGELVGDIIGFQFFNLV